MKNLVTASQAILQDWRQRFVYPSLLSSSRLDFDTLKDMYQEIGQACFVSLLDDFTAEELDYCISHMLMTASLTPRLLLTLVKLDGQYNLELFHGSHHCLSKDT